MYEIVFYADKNGNSPVAEYIESLEPKDDKDNKDKRIKFTKIYDYIYVLHNEGTRAGNPYVKHVRGEIWELRPLRDRFLFAGLIGNTIILLSHFMKTTPKTPPAEIEKAERLLLDYRRRLKL
jgi:phage-related protein